MAIRTSHLQQTLGLPAFANRGLFADHFLEHRLATLPEWHQVEGLEEAFTAIKKRYREHAARFTSRTNEAQTEHDFIQPVLDILWRDREAGDCYQVQARIPNIDERTQPDYAFFRSAADRQSAATQLGTLDFWRDAPCLGDAKKWSASLDREPGSRENPTAQVCKYLYRSRVRWGILTNGRTWRLYEREKSSAGGIYYEFGLDELLTNHDTEAFKYFYLFFRREAFLPDASGETFLQKVFQGSIDYATEVGDRLKDSVYDALRLLMNGFLQHAPNGLDRHDPATLVMLHENCLIVLYRLLFLLYAEDRDLLPRKEEPYASNSLYRLQREINAHLREGKSYLAAGRRFWGELTNLFDLIDGGFDTGGIPAYNGGLFTPARYPHLAHTPQPGQARWEIGDRFLADAIDRLAYERERWNEPGSRDVDYAMLEVQHLGSIYEGLLELRPHVASEPLVETLVDSKPVFEPARDVPSPRPVRGQAPRTVNAGDVYLVSDRGERKATGSYYTPKYIVDYIVQNTVGPLAEGAARQVAKLRSKVDEAIARLDRKRRQFVRKGKQVGPAAVAGDIASIDVQIDEQKRRLLEPYLSLRVLDPAMGSGHFLVGAADFLSIEMATDPNLLPPEAAGDDAQAYYKRRVVERCLYGVDLNPLAVELAKLSLWLHTVSRDKALSFLDHHLRRGNSLIGARLREDLMKEPPRANPAGWVVKRDSSQPRFAAMEIFKLAHIQSLLDTFRKIGDLPGGDVASERNKDQWYKVMDAERDRFRAVANCWLVPLFGVPVSAEQYEEAVCTLQTREEGGSAVVEQAWFQANEQMARHKGFFHWELEFPEAFFDGQGFKADEERGFDAVLGNPPYGRLLNEKDLSYAEETYRSCGSTFDVFGMFMERGASVLRAGHPLGIIVPSGWLTGREHLALREAILANVTPRAIVHLPYDVFPDAYIDCILFVGTTKPCQAGDQCLVKRYGIREVVREMPHSPGDYVAIDAGHWLADSDRLMVTETRAGLWLRRWAQSPRFIPAGDLIRVTRGITPYKQPDARDSRQTARGFFGSVGRYDLQAEKFATVVYDPSLAEYKPRVFFSGKRLIIRRIISRQHRLHATMVTENFVINKSYLLAIPVSKEYALEYVLAILNSRLLSCAFVSMSEIAKRDDFPQVDIATVQEFPIPKVVFRTPAHERRRMLDKLKRLYDSYSSSDESDSVLGRLDSHLNATPSQADVVHDFVGHIVREMVRMNEEKRSEMTAFLTWLERRIGREIDALSGKTTIRAYDEFDLGTLWTVLRTNRRRLTVDPQSRSVQESLEREYIKSMEKLNPLNAKITATDHLIDLIVYRLYGLTESEMAIVERSDAGGQGGGRAS